MRSTVASINALARVPLQLVAAKFNSSNHRISFRLPRHAFAERKQNISPIFLFSLSYERHVKTLYLVKRIIGDSKLKDEKKFLESLSSLFEKEQVNFHWLIILISKRPGFFGSFSTPQFLPTTIAINSTPPELRDCFAFRTPILPATLSLSRYIIPLFNRTLRSY